MHLLNQMIAGAAVSSTASEPPGPSGLTWTNTLNVTVDSTSIVKSTNEAYAYANTVNVIPNGGSESYFEMDRTTTVTGYEVIISLGLASAAPHNDVPTGMVSLVCYAGTYCDIEIDNTYVSDTSFTDTDVIRLGFDGSNHVRIWKNGTPVYTSTGTYAAGDYILVVNFAYDTLQGVGMENISIG